MNNLHWIRIIVRQYITIILFWIVIIFVLLELILHNFCLHKLPLKFQVHLEGPVQRFSQYSKSEVLPKDYIAIVGDSYAHGFGPWLYDNSWSWRQPHFASQHLLHESLNADVISFGYPGFGNFGSAVSFIAELRFSKNSHFWNLKTDPNLILFYFYEGNDLVNNLHEVQHRGIIPSLLENGVKRKMIRRLIDEELDKVSHKLGLNDELASINVFTKLLKNYATRLTDPVDVSSQVNSKLVQENSDGIPHPQNPVEDPQNVIKLLDETNIKLQNFGFAEGPALLLEKFECDFSLMILEESLRKIKNEFPSSSVAVVYLPSALSMYDFSSAGITPAPIEMNGKQRKSVFAPSDAIDQCEYLRESVGAITQRLSISLIDPYPVLKGISKTELLHGPRDPIHFNRKGYEAFSASILKPVSSLFGQ